MITSSDLLFFYAIPRDEWHKLSGLVKTALHQKMVTVNNTIAVMESERNLLNEATDILEKAKSYISMHAHYGAVTKEGILEDINKILAKACNPFTM